MKYTLEYDNISGICLFRIKGEHRRPDDSHKLLRTAGSFADQHECSRFLFDMREATIISRTIDAYQTAIDPERFGFSRLFCVAAVYPVITKQEKFMENVGVNRGSINFQVFHDIDEALGWLKTI